jgi:hypothetical protein
MVTPWFQVRAYDNARLAALVFQNPAATELFYCVQYRVIAVGNCIRQLVGAQIDDQSSPMKLALNNDCLLRLASLLQQERKERSAVSASASVP